MNTSDSTPDDSHWSSLAHELGLDSTPSPPPHAAADDASTPDLHLPDAHDDEDTMVEPALSAEPFVETEEAGTEEQTDEGGKRRRRRRRRRRKGGPGEPTTAEAAAEGEEPAEEGFAEDDEPTADAPATVVMKDVVANWNVPSWDELIGGLYRPGN